MRVVYLTWLPAMAAPLALALALSSCQEAPKPCKDRIFDKDKYSSVECGHPDHRLVDRDEQWFCQCQKSKAPKAASSASARPENKTTKPAMPAEQKSAQPAAQPQAKPDDYSWLDTEY